MVGSCLSSLFKNHLTSAKSASFAVHFVTKICQLFLSFGMVLLGSMLLGIILFGVMPFVVMSFAVMPFGIMLFGIMSFRIMSFGIKSFGIMLFGTMLFGVMLFRRYIKRDNVVMVYVVRGFVVWDTLPVTLLVSGKVQNLVLKWITVHLFEGGPGLFC